MRGSHFWICRLTLLAITVLAYRTLWQNDFIDFDDEALITHNSHVIEGLSSPGIRWAWTNQEAPYWMPITWLSFQFDALFPCDSRFQSSSRSNLNPVVFHFQNLFWHCWNVQLLFVLVLLLTGRAWRSFLVAALFAVHPMHVESVAWAIERKDVLMCFFGLLSLLCYVHYVKSHARGAYLGMLLAYQASLMSKPMLLSLPFILLLLDFWPLCRFGTRSTGSPLVGRLVGASILEKLPVFAVALTMAAQTAASRPGNAMPDVGMIDRTMNAFAAYGWYLSETIYPHHLAVFYPHPCSNWSLIPSLIGVVLVFSITVLAISRAKRWRWLPVGWFWFVGTLIPVIGLTQGGHQAWADRFSYWPHIGMFIVVVWGIAELANWFRIPVLIGKIISCALLFSLMAMTCDQVTYWRTSTILWEHAIAVTESNDRAHEHLAICYRREGRIVDAEYHLREAARIQWERQKHPAHQ